MNSPKVAGKDISDAVQAGKLPGRPPLRTWAGPASGQERCLLCDQVFPVGQFVWEAEFATHSGAASHFFHISCFWLLAEGWDEVEEGTEDAGLERGPGRP